MSLSQLLREGTVKEHREAETSRVVQSLFRGLVTRDVYGKLLECLYHLYNELERQIEIHRSTEYIDKFYFPELNRAESLYSDLIFFMGNSYNPGSPLEKTAKYIDHIKYISGQDPLKLIAHAYVRYLGDLSGGQILGRVIRKTFALSSGSGDLFYTFPIEDVDQFKNKYRAQLDALPLDKFRKEEILSEAKLAFQLNGEMFSELDVYLLSPKL